MENIFKNMDIEKRDKIINSALEEFSKNRFDKASTNNIVKNAGISKGLLFHYFPNKKNLYDHLETFTMDTMINAILDEIDWEEKDLISRIKQIVLIKFRVFVRYPYLITFGKVIYENKSVDEIKELVETYVPDIYHQIFYKNVDFTLLKKNVEKEKIIKIIQWTMEKLSEEWMNNLALSSEEVDLEGMNEEIDVYLKILKEAFYK